MCHSKRAYCWKSLQFTWFKCFERFLSMQFIQNKSIWTFYCAFYKDIFHFLNPNTALKNKINNWTKQQFYLVPRGTVYVIIFTNVQYLLLPQLLQWWTLMLNITPALRTLTLTLILGLILTQLQTKHPIITLTLKLCCLRYHRRRLMLNITPAFTLTLTLILLLILTHL